RIVIIISLLFSLQSLANTLKVAGLREFEIEFDSESIRFSSEKKNLKFQKLKCNEVIFKTVKERLRLIKSGPTLYKGEVPNKFNFRLDGTLYHEEIGSYRAKYLLSLPEEMERLKLEES